MCSGNSKVTSCVKTQTNLFFFISAEFFLILEPTACLLHLPSLRSSFPCRSFPRELLHHDHSEGQSWASSFPAVHLQRAGGAAVGSGAGPLACLPVRGPDPQAHPRELPPIQRRQPGWWQVSNHTRHYIWLLIIVSVAAIYNYFNILISRKETSWLNTQDRLTKF